MKANLIRCPNCESKGLKQTLGEILPSGYIAVERRHHKDYGFDYTVVAGTNFSILCGYCGEEAYRKEQTNEDVSHNRVEWVYRQVSYEGTAVP